MTNHHDLLIEIFTEELPPKRLSMLEQTFASNIEKQLRETQLAFSSIRSFSTPRRLAVIVEKLAEQQPTQKIERKGPNVAQAFDAQGQLTPAGKGFLNACGITQDQVSIINTDKGECLNYIGEKPGLSVTTLVPEIVKTALKELPIPKPMRWGNNDFSFIRPVHSIILLYGENVIDAEFFGIKTDRISYGHRQMCHQEIVIGFPHNYETELAEAGFVVVDTEKRKKIILDQIESLLQKQFSGRVHAQLDAGLLEEVTALVEWPKTLLCQFDEAFLSVPQEALIASMQGHQKCFPIADQNKQLLPYFLTVSNLESKDEAEVIRGNERVMRARLSDAKFFYETDLKASLESYIPRLSTIIYQEKLGTLKDKVTRVSTLAANIAVIVGATGRSPSSIDIVALVERAAQLCKLDLLSNMVGEFPELQGIMGKYYALQEGENPAVAHAIEEHYWPRFSEDKIPTAPVSVALALADRLDTIVGFFSVGLIPTGDKDPFALRRAASGMLKIIIENQLPMTLDHVINKATTLFSNAELNLTDDIAAFFKERLKSIMLEKNITIDVFNTIPKPNLHNLCEVLKCMQAFPLFKNHPDAASIIQADKRVKNILAKNHENNSEWFFSTRKCEKEIETILMQKISDTRTTVNSLIKKSDYSGALLALSELRPFVDRFFEEVMVMADNLELRHNRLAIVKQLRELFLSVGDLSELQL